jgi:hypothetical protein
MADNIEGQRAIVHTEAEMGVLSGAKLIYESKSEDYHDFVNEKCFFHFFSGLGEICTIKFG